MGVGEAATLMEGFLKFRPLPVSMRTSQPRPAERTERYLAIPCSGNPSVEINHLNKILDYEHPSGRVTFRGWMTEEQAKQHFGNDKVYFSDSHGLCPSCDRTLDKLL